MSAPQSIKAPFRYSPARERISLAFGRLLGGNSAQRAKLLYRGLRYRRIMDYIPIDGWLAHGEAITLYETACSLPGPAPIAAEIGSWMGKSSIVIAKGLQDRGGGTLYCIDPFNADGEDASIKDYADRSARVGGALLDQFKNNVARAGVASFVHPLPGYSHDVIQQFREPLDFLFIDGNHAYDAVCQDIRQWTPLLKPGGYLLFHDVSFNNRDTGPQQAVRDLILDRPEWTDHLHVQGLFRTRKAQ
ncbi:MAG: class I SAM-dependent methyltransferase [Verrucomicrobia bacterium]|nr:class I SAM-dependent methyltransferase [Verrucomicrobiota bacterium]